MASEHLLSPPDGVQPASYQIPGLCAGRGRLACMGRGGLGPVRHGRGKLVFLPLAFPSTLAGTSSLFFPSGNEGFTYHTDCNLDFSLEGLSVSVAFAVIQCDLDLSPLWAFGSTSLEEEP